MANFPSLITITQETLIPAADVVRGPVVVRAVGTQLVQGPPGPTGPTGAIGPTGPIGPGSASNLLLESGRWYLLGDVKEWRIGGSATLGSTASLMAFPFYLEKPTTIAQFAIYNGAALPSPVVFEFGIYTVVGAAPGDLIVTSDPMAVLNAGAATAGVSGNAVAPAGWNYCAVLIPALPSGATGDSIENGQPESFLRGPSLLPDLAFGEAGAFSLLQALFNGAYTGPPFATWVATSTPASLPATFPAAALYDPASISTGIPLVEIQVA